MNTILTSFIRDIQNPPDLAEKIGTMGLGLLRVGLGKTVIVENISGDMTFKQKVYPTSVKVAALSLFFLCLPLTIPLAGLGCIAQVCSKSHRQMLTVYHQKLCADRTKVSLKTNQSELEKSLDLIVYPSFLSRLKKIYISNQSQLNNLQNLWLLTVLQLFLDSYIEEESCSPRVTWKDSLDDCYDCLGVKQTHEHVVYRHDCLNDQLHHVAPLSLKRALNELTFLEKRDLAEACRSSEDRGLDEKVYSCLTQLQTVTFSIQDRYDCKVSNFDSIDIKDFIYEKVKNAFKSHLVEIAKKLEILEDSEFAFKVCRDIIKDLLLNARIEGQQLWITPDVCLSFIWEDLNCLKQDELRYISFSQVNDLNSKNILEEPYITDQPLKLANFLQEDPSRPIETHPEFEHFKNWFQKNYYNSFCAQWMRLFASQQSVVTPKSVKINTSTAPQVLSNDQGGDLYMSYIEHQFEVQASWSLNGSCVFSCLFPEYKKNLEEGYKKAAKTRALMSAKMKNDWNRYLDYVVVIPGFSQLSQTAQIKLKQDHWVMTEDESIKSKQKAIESRAELLLQSETWLMEPELDLASEVVDRPVWIYKRRAETFIINPKGQLVPHVVYGEKRTGLPCYVLDDYDHYKLLIRKSIERL